VHTIQTTKSCFVNFYLLDFRLYYCGYAMASVQLQSTYNRRKCYDVTRNGREATVKDETAGVLCLNEHTGCSKSRYTQNKIVMSFLKNCSRRYTQFKPTKMCFYMLPFRFSLFQHCEPKFRPNVAIHYS
jgi:hypothetical protein